MSDFTKCILIVAFIGSIWLYKWIRNNYNIKVSRKPKDTDYPKLDVEYLRWLIEQQEKDVEKELTEKEIEDKFRQ